MPLNPAQVAAINHLVAKELAGISGVGSDKEFCERINFPLGTFQEWTRKDDSGAHKHPEFVRVLNASLKEARESTDLYALRTRQWALEELSALYKKAKTANEKRQVLKDILKETEGVSQSKAVIDYSSLPDSQLVEMALAANLTVTGISEERLAELAKGA